MYIYMCVCVCVFVCIYIYCVCVCFSKNCGSSIDNPIAQWVPLCYLLFILLSTETWILGISSLSMHGEQKIPLTLSNPWNLHAHQIWVWIQPSSCPRTLQTCKRMEKTQLVPRNRSVKSCKIYVHRKWFLKNGSRKRSVSWLSCCLSNLAPRDGPSLQAFTKPPTFMKERRARKNRRIRFSLGLSQGPTPRARKKAGKKRPGVRCNLHFSKNPTDSKRDHHSWALLGSIRWFGHVRMRSPLRKPFTPAARLVTHSSHMELAVKTKWKQNERADFEASRFPWLSHVIYPMLSHVSYPNSEAFHVVVRASWRQLTKGWPSKKPPTDPGDPGWCERKIKAEWDIIRYSNV